METTETKFSPRRYGANWLIITVVLITGLSAGFGWNTVTKSVDLFDGFSTLWDIFGGITSFGGILFLLLCVAIIVYGLHKMTQTDYTQSRNKKRLRWVHIGFGFAFVAFAAWMGVSWIHLPSGLGWTALLLLVIPTVFAFMVRNVRVTKLVQNDTDPDD